MSKNCRQEHLIEDSKHDLTLTSDVVAAGVRALLSADSRFESDEDIVADIFFAMLRGSYGNNFKVGLSTFAKNTDVNAK